MRTRVGGLLFPTTLQDANLSFDTLPSLEEALQNQEVVSSNRAHDRGGSFSGSVWSQDSLSAYGASSEGGVLSRWSWYFLGLR